MHAAAVAATVAVTFVADVRLSGMHHVLGVATLLGLMHRMLGVGCNRSRSRLPPQAVARVNDRCQRDRRHAH